MRQHYPPGNGKGHAPRRRQPARRAAPDQTSANQARPTTSPTRIIARAQHVVDSAALLALDLAAVATESGRGDHARAVVDLLECAHHAWCAAEVLAESAGVA